MDGYVEGADCAEAYYERFSDNGEFELLASCARLHFDIWSHHRTALIDDLRVVAKGLDQISRRQNVGNVFGSAIGITGGATVVVGMVLLPPVALIGLGIGVVAGVTNATAVGYKCFKNYKLATPLRDSLLQDVTYLTTYKECDERFRSMERGLDSDAISSGGSSISLSSLGDQTAKSLAVTVGVTETTEILLQAAFNAGVLLPVVALVTAHSLAGIGITIDALSMIISISDLVKGSCTLALKLRNQAKMMEDELREEHILMFGSPPGTPPGDEQEPYEEPYSDIIVYHSPPGSEQEAVSQCSSPSSSIGFGSEGSDGICGDIHDDVDFVSVSLSMNALGGPYTGRETECEYRGPYASSRVHFGAGTSDEIPRDVHNGGDDVSLSLSSNSVPQPARQDTKHAVEETKAYCSPSTSSWENVDQQSVQAETSATSAEQISVIGDEEAAEAANQSAPPQLMVNALRPATPYDEEEEQQQESLNEQEHERTIDTDSLHSDIDFEI